MGSNTFVVKDADNAEAELYAEFVVHAPDSVRKDIERAVNRAVARIQLGDTRMYNEVLGCWIQVGKLI